MPNRTYKVVVPGQKQPLEIEGPDDASDDELISIAKEHIATAYPKGRFADPVVDRPKTGADTLVDSFSPAATGRSTITTSDLVAGKPPRDQTITTSLPALFTQGATFGLSDEIMGGAGALVDAVTAPFSSSVDFNPAASYRAYRDRERKRIAYTREDNPWASSALELAGGITNLPAKAAAGARSLLATLKSAPKIGAASGAAAGFGYGEGADGSLAGAGIGTALGAGLGVALPVAANWGGNAIRVARDFLNPRNGIAREEVVRSLAADHVTPQQLGAAMDAAHARGVPFMPADVGENTRNLLASVGRKPGPSQRIVKQAVIERQMQQGNRIRGAIERDLGPIANPYEVSDQLARRAQRSAAPLYEQAYSLPLTVPEALGALMARPSVQRALQKARTIAAEEGRDPEKLGFVQTADGIVSLPNAPSLQTYDYVKRGLDDVLEGYRDKTSGRLVLDTEGGAIEQTRKALVAALDNAGDAGSAYKAARAAYAGPAGQKAALAKGRSALTMSDQELERATATLKPGEKEQFALGLRTALADTLERRVDGSDKVNALLGTPRKRKALAQVFGGEENFGRFMQTMADEAQGALTYRAVNTGSQTAERLAADAATSDEAMLADLAGSAIQATANGGLLAGAANLFGRVKDVSRFGAGKTGERARQEIGALLSEIDPQALREAMRKALRDQAIRRVRAHGQLLGTIRATNLGSRAAGGVAGRAVSPRD